MNIVIGLIIGPYRRFSLRLSMLNAADAPSFADGNGVPDEIFI